MKLAAASRGESSIPEVLLILDSLVYPTVGCARCRMQDLTPIILRAGRGVDVSEHGDRGYQCAPTETESRTKT